MASPGHGLRSRVARFWYTRGMSTRNPVIPALAASLLLASCAPQTAPLRPLAAPKPTEGVVVYVSGQVDRRRAG
jgi:hypothetical protein